MLSHDILAAWASLLQTNPDLASPYFTPAFTQIVAAARDDVEVAVVEDEGKVVALFPYQRGKFNIGGPVGGIISDYQALICRPDFTLQPRELLQSCGLVAWDFNHLLTSQTFFHDFHWRKHYSSIIDLSEGFEAYVKARKDTGSDQIQQCGKFARRLEREVGPLRFVSHLPEAEALDELITWKSEHLRQRRMRDPFALPWVQEVLHTIHATQTAHFGGILSALYAGERRIAMHFGMHSATIWHGWFLVYDPVYAKSSPGLILLLKMAEHAAALGLKIIDLGGGAQSYKHRLRNGVVPLAVGSVEVPCLATAVRRVITPVRKIPFKVRCLISKTPVGALARRIRDGK